MFIVFQESGKKFDFVFGDLTDTPVSDAEKNSNDTWLFLKEILDLGTSVMKPECGRYMTHCNGKSAFKTVERYENGLRELKNGELQFKKREKFVNSFMEVWVFYELFFKQS